MYRVFNDYYGVINNASEYYSKYRSYFDKLIAELSEIGIVNGRCVYFGDGAAVNVKLISMATQHNFPTWVCDIYNGISFGTPFINEGFSLVYPERSAMICYWECDGVGYCINCSHSSITSGFISYIVGSVIIGENTTAGFYTFNPKITNSESPFVASDNFANITLIRDAVTKKFVMIGNKPNIKNGLTMGHYPVKGLDGIERVYSFTMGELGNKPTGEFGQGVVVASSYDSNYRNMYSDVKGDIINGGKLALYDIGIGLDKGGYLGKLNDIYCVPRIVNRGELININGEMFIGLGMAYIRRSANDSMISSYWNRVIVKC